MVSDDDIKAAVAAAIAKRNRTLSPLELEVLVQFVRGQLRVSTFPVDQVALKFTDLLLDGRRNTPPNPYRPQLRQLVRSLYATNTLPPPADDVVDILVSVAAGLVIDHSLPVIPAGRAVVIRGVVNLYLVGTPA